MLSFWLILLALKKKELYWFNVVESIGHFLKNEEISWLNKFK